MNHINITILILAWISSVTGYTRHSGMILKSEANFGERPEPTQIHLMRTSYRAPAPILQTRSLTVTRVDDVFHGYGMNKKVIQPLDVSENGWFIAYNHRMPTDGSQPHSGRLSSAYSPDGSTWEIYTDLNMNVEIFGQNGGQAYFVNAVMSETSPYILWLDRAQLNYLHRFYTFDNAGFGGGDFVIPYNQFPNGIGIDIWRGSPGYALDNEGTEHFFQLFEDYNVTHSFLSHFSITDGGETIFPNDVQIFDYDYFGGMECGLPQSSPILSMNRSGTGYAAIVSSFDCAVPEYDQMGTVIFRKTEDYGMTWSTTGYGQNPPYYSIPDNVLQHLMESGHYFDNSFSDGCTGETEPILGMIMNYALDIKTDSQGNLHIIAGIIPHSMSYFLFGLEGTGYYHFTIEQQHLENPGEPCSSDFDDCSNAAGWTYSKVLDMSDAWTFDHPSGWSYWNTSIPSLSISQNNDEILYLVTSKIIPYNMVDYDDDPCNENEIWPWASEDIIIVKSENGGASWSVPLNVSNSPGNLATSVDDWAEHSAHVGPAFGDNQVTLVYQMPNWEWNSTGDPDAVDHVNHIYAGYAELDFDDSDIPLGDTNCDGTVSVNDVVYQVNYIMGDAGFSFWCGDLTYDVSDVNSDGLLNIQDILLTVQIILGN